MPPATTTGDGLARTRAQPGESAPLRVGFAAGAAVGGLSSWVDAMPLPPARRKLGGGPATEVESLDALVVDRPGPALDGPAIRALCERARAAGVPVVGIRRDGPEPAWAGVADVETGVNGSTPELTAAPAVDVERFHPGPFSNAGVAGYLAVVDAEAPAPADQAPLKALTAAMPFGPVFIEGP